MDSFTEPVSTLADEELRSKYQAFSVYEGQTYYSHNAALFHMYKDEMKRRGLLEESARTDD